MRAQAKGQGGAGTIPAWSGDVRRWGRKMSNVLTSCASVLSEERQIHDSSSSIVIVSCAFCSNAKAVQRRSPDLNFVRVTLFPGHCCQSFRHGSRANQENIHLACQSGQKVCHIRDDYHIIIRRTREQKWVQVEPSPRKGLEVNMLFHES